MIRAAMERGSLTAPVAPPRRVRTNLDQRFFSGA